MLLCFYWRIMLNQVVFVEKLCNLPHFGTGLCIIAQAEISRVALCQPVHGLYKGFGLQQGQQVAVLINQVPHFITLCNSAGSVGNGGWAVTGAAGALGGVAALGIEISKALLARGGQVVLGFHLSFFD